MNILFNFRSYGMIHSRKTYVSPQTYTFYGDINISFQGENFEVQEVVLIKKTH